MPPAGPIRPTNDDSARITSYNVCYTKLLRVAVNRGKRSVCVDLTSDLGSRAVRALLEKADVFLTNYRASALERLGLRNNFV